MATLYEINEAIASCIDPETGEIIDIGLWESAQLQRETKLENIACWIKNLLSDAEAYKAEKEILAEREKRARLKAEGLKILLSDILDGQKLSTPKCAVTFRRSRSVEVDEATLSKEWCNEKITCIPDKMRIKSAIEAGRIVEGARLIEKLNIQIK